MVEHMVLIKFSPDTSLEQKGEVIQRLRALKDEIPGIVDLQSNHNFSSRSQGYDIGLSVRFEDRASLEAYGPHPKHQAVVAFMKSVGAVDTLVVDFDIPAER